MLGSGPLALAALTIALPTALTSASGTAPGDLDITFGDGGHALVDVGSWGARASAVAVQPDGKIVLAGYTRPAPPPPSPARAPDGDENLDFVVARLDSNGSLDPTFGTDGVVRTPIDLIPNGADLAWAIALGPDGSIVVAGEAAQVGSTHDFAFVRYTSTGALDTTFSDDGIQTVDIGGPDIALGVAIQPADQKIIAVGAAGPFTTMRLQADGDLDSTFGSGGLVQTSLGDLAAQDIASAVALRPDGKIVVAGTADLGDFAVVRYLSDGELDPGFGAGGVVLTEEPNDQSVASLSIAPDGRIALAGLVYVPAQAFRLERYLENGELDASFGEGGMVTTQFGSYDNQTGLVAQSDGKLVAAGWTYTSQYVYVLARYLDDGSLDSSFGDGGTRTYQFAGSGEQEYGSGVSIQTLSDDPVDERIIEVGTLEPTFVHGYMAAIRVFANAPAPPPPPPPPPPPARCRVPGVVGLALGRARVRIRRAHCSVGRIRRVRSRRPAGRVLSQRPRRGRVLSRGARVNLVVSRGR